MVGSLGEVVYCEVILDGLLDVFGLFAFGGGVAFNDGISILGILYAGEVLSGVRLRGKTSDRQLVVVKNVDGRYECGVSDLDGAIVVKVVVGEHMQHMIGL